MMKRIIISIFLLFLLLPQILFSTATNRDKEALLAQGHLFTDGGYIDREVWGEMEGVIEAATEVVWKIFIQPNEWMRWKLAMNLTDSRTVTEETVEKLGSTEKVKDFYEVVGSQWVDVMKYRKEGSTWKSYTFQYFDLPWPLKNRWMIGKNGLDESKSSEGIYKAKWELVTGNVRTFRGHLELKRFRGNKNRTHLYYWTATHPGAKIPKFILRWGVQRALPYTVQSIRRVAKEEAKKPYPLLKIQ